MVETRFNFKTPLDERSVEELETYMHELLSGRERIREKQREITRIMDKKIEEQHVARRIATFTNEEKRALFQSLKSEGIESGEKHG